jgi:hypothetical protein
MTSAGLGPKADPRDVARYIEHMARELRTLAAGADLGFLAYLLAMVEDEGSNAARKSGGSKPPS